MQLDITLMKGNKKTMRKTVLFIAISLDGYIADQDGAVDWLNGENTDTENIDTYSEFVKTIDTVIMGWNTYHQVITELSPTEWVYSDLTTYVITHRKLTSSDKIKFVSQDPCSFLQQIKSKPGKDIWICGGADIVQQFMAKDLIDTYYISIIPTLLGNGISLFGTLEKERKLSLIKTQNYHGIVELIYERRLS